MAAVHVRVFRGPCCKGDGQLLRISEPSKLGPHQLLKLVAAKLKVKPKDVSLYRYNGQPIDVMADIAELKAGEALCLCTLAEAATLAQNVNRGAATQVLDAVVELSPEIWFAILDVWLHMQHKAHETYIDTRTLNKAHRSKYAVAAESAEAGEDIVLDKLDKAYIPCLDALRLSVVCRAFHRQIGASRALDLLGQWFWRDDNKSKRWISYGSSANWDLEIARFYNECDVTICVCEAEQEGSCRRGGKPRRRHVFVDLAAMRQGNLNGRGREVTLIRRPRVIIP